MQRFGRFGNFAFAIAAVAVFAIALPLPLSAADLPLRPPPEMKQPPAKTEPPARSDQKSDEDFAHLAANCIEATDGCRTWRRAADGKFDPLNNIGIACQPKKAVCTSSK